jgi:hypothetical protein
MKRLAWLPAVLLALTAPSLAQSSRPSSRPAPAPAPKEAAKPASDEDRWFAVHAGEVYPVSGPVLRNVTILAKNGTIAQIGSGLLLPKGTEELDARALRVYPGLVAFDSGGIVGPVPQDSTDVYGLNLTLALSTGLTTVGAGSTICKLTYGTLDGHVLGRRRLLSLVLGSAAARKTLRQSLDAARSYLRAKSRYEQAKAKGEDVKPPKPLKGRAGAYLGLLRGETRALVRASSTRALTEIANLGLTYGFRAVITGAEEAWTVAPLLGRAGFSVLVVPRARRGSDPRSNRAAGWSIENAATLHAHGVPIGVMSRSKGIGTGGLAGSDLFTLALEAAFSVRGGLPETAALEAITLGPARLLGVDNRIGSIEVGKDCDLVITRGDLLHYQTLPQWTIVNGRIAYDKEKDSLLRAVRSRNLGWTNAPVPQLWPRPAGTPQPEISEDERR